MPIDRLVDPVPKHGIAPFRVTLAPGAHLPGDQAIEGFLRIGRPMLAQFASEQGRLDGVDGDLLFRTHVQKLAGQLSLNGRDGDHFFRAHVEELSRQLGLHVLEVGVLAQGQAVLLPEQDGLESPGFGEGLARRGQPQRPSQQQRLLEGAPGDLGG